MGNKASQLLEDILKMMEERRARMGIGKEELAKRMGVSPKTYYNWINEETDIPGSALLRLAALFNTEVDYLLRGSKFSSCQQVTN